MKTLLSIGNVIWTSNNLMIITNELDGETVVVKQKADVWRKNKNFTERYKENDKVVFLAEKNLTKGSKWEATGVCKYNEMKQFEGTITDLSEKYGFIEVEVNGVKEKCFFNKPVRIEKDELLFPVNNKSCSLLTKFSQNDKVYIKVLPLYQENSKKCSLQVYKMCKKESFISDFWKENKTNTYKDIPISKIENDNNNNFLFENIQKTLLNKENVIEALKYTIISL